KGVDEVMKNILSQVEASADQQMTNDLERMNNILDNHTREIDELQKQLKQEKDIIEAINQDESHKIAQELDKLSAEMESQKKATNEIQVKAVMDSMLNKLEFENIIGNVNEKIVRNEETGKMILVKLDRFNEQITKIDKDISEN